ncbi:MAG TPA: Gfo/Idh/MocA family oxidoreductase [Planctomycetaceae bacterium]|nr:Gfo/Idh/MocA family oxidoreductase [Planctomycetaceae bacterium]
MFDKSTRRDFLKNSTLLSTAWWVGQTSLFGADSKNPLERLNFGCIGVDGKGSSDTDDAARFGNIVALCDIDDHHLEKKRAQLKRRGKINDSVKQFNDYREMLDQMGDKIDAVTVSIPDHSHAPASIMAMKKGKHCFTQKPLTWSVYEARRMREVANEMKVATQMGNQGTANNGLREAVEIIRTGGIGNVKEVHVWTNRPIWPQGEGRPDKVEQPPKYVHWDLFLGPAPYRPYVNDVYHPFKWRGWLDFGTGALGDMACHTANMGVMALELFDPVAVEVKKTSGIVAGETYPKYSVIEYEFPERTTIMFKPGQKFPPCKLIWYDGQQYPPNSLLQGEKRAGSGMIIVGEEGSLYTPDDYGAEYVLLPRAKFEAYKLPERFVPRCAPGVSPHFKEWATACRGGAPATSNFNYSSRLTETMIMGNLALRAGSRVEWDAKNQLVTNNPSANKFVKREYRTGYSV